MAEAAPKLQEYTVTEECIACDACCNDFPEIFKMDADHTRAIAFAPIETGKYNPWDIVTVCPVDAIKLIKGEMPPPPEGMEEKAEESLVPVELADTRPWSVRWEEVKDRPEPEWERMKRYGMAYTINEELGKISYRFAMPAMVPDHIFKFKWGLPGKMPDYKIAVTIEGDKLKVFAKLEDKRVRKLCDIATSFPDRFLREFELPAGYTELTKNYNSADKILDLIITKADTAAEAAEQKAAA